DYHYDVEAPSAREPQPLDHFLFEARRGHCQFFATAMAVLLRAQGVPARSVTGFAGGTYNRFGRFYAVGQRHAHAWVEAYIDGRGWALFDPTPASDAPSGARGGPAAALRDVADSAVEGWDQHVAWYGPDQRAALVDWLLLHERAAG